MGENMKPAFAILGIEVFVLQSVVRACLRSYCVAFKLYFYKFFVDSCLFSEWYKMIHRIALTPTYRTNRRKIKMKTYPFKNVR